jgi:hypothetical protein
MTAEVVSAIVAVILVILALFTMAYKLGRSDSRIDRNERDVLENRNLIFQNRDQAESRYKELSAKISEGFSLIYKKIDELPCKNPGWSREKCQ